MTLTFAPCDSNFETGAARIAECECAIRAGCRRSHLPDLPDLPVLCGWLRDPAACTRHACWVAMHPPCQHHDMTPERLAAVLAERLGEIAPPGFLVAAEGHILAIRRSRPMAMNPLAPTYR